MSAGGAGLKAAIVFDVNVLIDAARPESPRYEAAVRALSDRNGMPFYFSDKMLGTTANKLLEMGADPAAVEEFIEFITSENDFGPKKHVLEHVPETDYGITDRFGNPDYEDSTIVSLMVAAEDHSGLRAVLVSNDVPLRDWCKANQRMNMSPERLPSLADELQKETFQYMSRRMFRQDAQPLPHKETKAQARQIVTNIRRELKQGQQIATPITEERYKRFPELRPSDAPEQASEEQGIFQR